MNGTNLSGQLKRIGFILLFLIFSISLFPSDVTVLKDVNPTMVEKNFKSLVKVKELGPDLGNDHYLFSPFSFVMGSRNTLYVYDRLQNKVILLDADGNYIKSFGRQGPGPGEFVGKGKLHMVFLSCNGERIYANDTRGFKVSIFDKDGKFIRHYKYKDFTFSGYIADVEGNLIFQDTDNEVFRVFNETNETLFTYPMGKRKIEYLFYEPSFTFSRKKRYKFFPTELLMKLTKDQKLLIYFVPSSTLLVVKDKKLIQEIRVWPKEALEQYREKVSGSSKMTSKRGRFKGRGRKVHRVFGNLFVDGDDENIVYFQSGINETRGIISLYRVNLQGHLVDVLTIPAKQGDPFTSFLVKQNGKFYAKHDDKIVIYREANK